MRELLERCLEFIKDNAECSDLECTCEGNDKAKLLVKDLKAMTEALWSKEK